LEERRHEFAPVSERTENVRMSRKPNPSTIETLIGAAYWEFNWAIDYVWKAPTLIERLTDIENQKLKHYTGNARLTRWSREMAPLKYAFPKFLSHGNLFAVTSLFEMYVLRLATFAERSAKPRLCETKGNGVARSLAYLRRVGIDTNGIVPWPQVDAALKVRNCLVHAGGILQFSRDVLELRRIVKSQTFFTPKHRGTSSSRRVRLIKSELGYRVSITNEYVFVVCAYLRDYFMALCDETRKVLCAPLFHAGAGQSHAATR
jgi:hypothetical protein